MSTPARMVKQALASSGFDDPSIEIVPSKVTAGVLVTWIGHGVWSFDAGMMRSSPITVSAIASSARGRELTRVLLDLADDEYEPFTE